MKEYHKLASNMYSLFVYPIFDYIHEQYVARLSKYLILLHLLKLLDL
jgi:hypothetical protein